MCYSDCVAVWGMLVTYMHTICAKGVPVLQHLKGH